MMNKYHVVLVLLLGLLITTGLVLAAEFAAQPPQDVWGELTAFGWVQLLVFVAVAFIGKVVHFWVDVKKSILREGGWHGLYRYFFEDHVKATVTAVISTFIAAGTFFTVNVVPVAWPTLVFSAFFVGYTSDSIFNRGVTQYS